MAKFDVQTDLQLISSTHELNIAMSLFCFVKWSHPSSMLAMHACLKQTNQHADAIRLKRDVDRSWQINAPLYVAFVCNW